jgi:hypothetical protein
MLYVIVWNGCGGPEKNFLNPEIPAQKIKNGKKEFDLVELFLANGYPMARHRPGS